MRSRANKSHQKRWILIKEDIQVEKDITGLSWTKFTTRHSSKTCSHKSILFKRLDLKISNNSSTRWWAGHKDLNSRSKFLTLRILSMTRSRSQTHYQRTLTLFKIITLITKTCMVPIREQDHPISISQPKCYIISRFRTKMNSTKCKEVFKANFLFRSLRTHKWSLSKNRTSQKTLASLSNPSSLNNPIRANNQGILRDNILLHYKNSSFKDQEKFLKMTPNPTMKPKPNSHPRSSRLETNGYHHARENRTHLT